jgi:LPPG:FO 2-phospho-L-lactate transferase
MLAGLGEEVSAFGVAAHYRDLLNGIVIDTLDADDAARIEALGMRVHITDTVMRTEEDRVRLAADVIRFAGTCSTR